MEEDRDENSPPAPPPSLGSILLTVSSTLFSCLVVAPLRLLFRSANFAWQKHIERQKLAAAAAKREEMTAGGEASEDDDDDLSVSSGDEEEEDDDDAEPTAQSGGEYRDSLVEEDVPDTPEGWVRHNPALKGFVIELQLEEGGEFIPIRPNSREPVTFENDLFKGKMLFMLATDPPDCAHLAQLTTVRTFEMQIQGELKVEPNGVLRMGAELSERPKINVIATQVVKAAMAFVQRRTSGLQWSLGDKAGPAKPYCAFPLVTGVDALVRSSLPSSNGSVDENDVADPPPVLGSTLPESDVDRAARRASTEDSALGLETGCIYSCTFYSGFVDFTNWKLSGMPVGSPSLDGLVGQQPIDVVVYDWRDDRDKRYWMRFRLRWDERLAELAKAAAIDLEKRKRAAEHKLLRRRRRKSRKRLAGGDAQGLMASESISSSIGAVDANTEVVPSDAVASGTVVGVALHVPTTASAEEDGLDEEERSRRRFGVESGCGCYCISHTRNAYAVVRELLTAPGFVIEKESVLDENADDEVYLKHGDVVRIMAKGSKDWLVATRSRWLAWRTSNASVQLQREGFVVELIDSSVGYLTRGSPFRLRSARWPDMYVAATNEQAKYGGRLVRLRKCITDDGAARPLEFVASDVPSPPQPLGHRIDAAREAVNTDRGDDLQVLETHAEGFDEIEERPSDEMIRLADTMSGDPLASSQGTTYWTVEGINVPGWIEVVDRKHMRPERAYIVLAALRHDGTSSGRLELVCRLRTGDELAQALGVHPAELTMGRGGKVAAPGALRRARQRAERDERRTLRAAELTRERASRDVQRAAAATRAAAERARKVAARDAIKAADAARLFGVRAKTAALSAIQNASKQNQNPQQQPLSQATGDQQQPDGAVVSPAPVQQTSRSQPRQRANAFLSGLSAALNSNGPRSDAGAKSKADADDQERKADDGGAGTEDRNVVAASNQAATTLSNDNEHQREQKAESTPVIIAGTPPATESLLSAEPRTTPNKQQPSAAKSPPSATSNMRQQSSLFFRKNVLPAAATLKTKLNNAAKEAKVAVDRRRQQRRKEEDQTQETELVMSEDSTVQAPLIDPIDDSPATNSSDVQFELSQEPAPAPGKLAVPLNTVDEDANRSTAVETAADSLPCVEEASNDLVVAATSSDNSFKASVDSRKDDTVAIVATDAAGTSGIHVETVTGEIVDTYSPLPAVETVDSAVEESVTQETQALPQGEGEVKAAESASDDENVPTSAREAIEAGEDVSPIESETMEAESASPSLEPTVYDSAAPSHQSGYDSDNEREADSAREVDADDFVDGDVESDRGMASRGPEMTAEGQVEERLAPSGVVETTDYLPPCSPEGVPALPDLREDDDDDTGYDEGLEDDALLLGAASSSRACASTPTRPWLKRDLETSARPPYHRSPADVCAHALGAEMRRRLKTTDSGMLDDLLVAPNSLDEGILRGGAAEIGVNLTSKDILPDGIAVIARARGEGHWVEQLAVLRTNRIDVFDPITATIAFTLSLREITGERKLSCVTDSVTDENAPSFSSTRVKDRTERPPFAVLVVETVGLCHYFGFASTARRDRWSASLALGRARAVDSLVVVEPTFANRDPRDDYVLKPSSYRGDRRLLLNCRRLLFDVVRPNPACKPWELSLALLRRVFALTPDADDLEMSTFFDQAALLRALPLSSFDDESPSAALAFFLNLHHAILQHALLVLGAPSKPAEVAGFAQSVSYDALGDVFSLNEIALCVVRGGLSVSSERKTGMDEQGAGEVATAKLALFASTGRRNFRDGRERLANLYRSARKGRSPPPPPPPASSEDGAVVVTTSVEENEKARGEEEKRVEATTAEEEKPTANSRPNHFARSGPKAARDQALSPPPTMHGITNWGWPHPPTPSDDDEHWDLALSSVDARVLLAVNVGSYDFPKTTLEFTPDDLSNQLDDAATRFFESPDAIQVDEARRIVTLPAICESLRSGGQAGRDVLKTCLRFVSKARWRQLSELLMAENPSVTVKFRQPSTRFHESLGLEKTVDRSQLKAAVRSSRNSQTSSMEDGNELSPSTSSHQGDNQNVIQGGSPSRRNSSTADSDSLRRRLEDDDDPRS